MFPYYLSSYLLSLHPFSFLCLLPLPFMLFPLVFASQLSLPHLPCFLHSFLFSVLLSPSSSILFSVFFPHHSSFLFYPLNSSIISPLPSLILLPESLFTSLLLSYPPSSFCPFQYPPLTSSFFSILYYFYFLLFILPFFLFYTLPLPLSSFLILTALPFSFFIPFHFAFTFLTSPCFPLSLISSHFSSSHIFLLPLFLPFLCSHCCFCPYHPYCPLFLLHYTTLPFSSFFSCLP